MKWLSKLFKNSGSNHGSGGTSYRQHPQFLEEGSTVWPVPRWSLDERSRADKEREELDHAIALALAEDLKRPNGQRCRSNTDEDYNLPLHDSQLNPLYPPYDLSHYKPRSYRVCGGCTRDIGYGNYLSCMGTYFHPDCFRCRSCGYPITEQEFSLSGKDPYHNSCFKELTHPKCEVCHQFVRKN